MKVVIADDDEVNRKLLRAIVTGEGYEVIDLPDGLSALNYFQQTDEPIVGLIDWEMPGMEGDEVCEQVRQIINGPPFHLILLTARDSKTDVVAGLRAGANDYVVKPFDRTELLARVAIGAQMVNLQGALTQHVKELQEALQRVKQLSGLLPICSYCKKIRDDSNYWSEVESYVSHHSDVQFSHSVCPHCYEQIVKPELEKLGVDTDEPGS